MQGNFSQVFEWVMATEGLFVNDARDPGGATCMGVTQKTYDTFRASSGKASRSVGMIDKREAEIIFRVGYWLRVRGDELPSRWDYATVDFAYNSGPGEAVRLAQLVLGTDVDGMMGPQTINAMRQAGPDKLAAYLDARLAFLKGLRTWPTFGKGWTARVDDVRARTLNRG